MVSFSSFNRSIRDALIPVLGPDANGDHPIAHLYYSGPASRYAIFNTGQKLPEVFGSGSNRVVRGYAYVDYFSKSDDSGPGGTIEQIETALNASDGMVCTQVSDVGRDDEGWFHTEFTLTLTARVV